MEPLQNIKLTFKCPKQLNELQPCNGDWYCDGCRKVVRDFRGMSEHDVLNIIAKADHQTCGVFDTGQIEVLPQRGMWFKWASITLMGLLSSTIQACKNSVFDLPPANPAKQANYHATMGIVLLPISPVPAKNATYIQRYLNSTVSNPHKYRGEVKLRVNLNEKYQVKSVKILSGGNRHINSRIIKALKASPAWLTIPNTTQFITTVNLTDLPVKS